MRLLLVEDHQIVRQGLRAVLQNEDDFQIVGEAADAATALRLVEELNPDVLVLDWMLQGVGSLEVTRSVSQRFPGISIVILSMHADVAYVSEALRAGAVGYVLKEESAKDLCRAIRKGASGETCVSPTISEEALRAYERRVADVGPNPLLSLTSREREILKLTAYGLSGAEIAEQLFISPRTVESHRANVMRKLGIRNQKDMVRIAVENGLAPTRP
jgi:DNA-binding NarL/FixJ family response regulator